MKQEAGRKESGQRSKRCDIPSGLSTTATIALVVVSLAISLLVVFSWLVSFTISISTTIVLFTCTSRSATATATRVVHFGKTEMSGSETHQLRLGDRPAQHTKAPADIVDIVDLVFAISYSGEEGGDERGKFQKSAKNERYLYGGLARCLPLCPALHLPSLLSLPTRSSPPHVTAASSQKSASMRIGQLGK